MSFAERFGWTLLVSCVLGVLLILVGNGIPDAWGITLQELAQGEKREKAETGTFLAWLREFLGYVTSSFLLEGAWLAVKITVLAMAIGLFLGLVLALMRLSGIWPVSAVAWFYIWFMRGTPQLLQLVFIFDALPLIGLRFDTFTTAVIGFALNEAAFSGEIIRGGIISVDRNQSIAAKSLGMGPTLTLRRIIMPQALRPILPAITNDTISMLKLTSIASVIFVNELTFRAQQIVGQNFKFFTVFAAAAVIYLVMTVPSPSCRRSSSGASAWRRSRSPASAAPPRSGASSGSAAWRRRSCSRRVTLPPRLRRRSRRREGTGGGYERLDRAAGRAAT